MIMDKESQRVLSCFEEASREGWLNLSDLHAIHQELEAKGPSSERLDWLRGQVMQVLHRKAQDEKSKRLVAWADKALRLMASASGTSQSTQVHFNPGNACHDALLSCLNEARFRLDICVFTITDDRITYQIRRAASRGVSVRIITDDDKSWDLGSDIHDLADSGMQVRQDFSKDHMHHKFVVVDDREVATGSFNWTRNSSNNYENILTCGDSQVVLAYRQEFDRLWSMMDPVQTA